MRSKSAFRGEASQFKFAHIVQPRNALAVACVLTCLAAAGSNSASARPVDCELTINGRSYTSGACEFESTGSDGSFMMRGDRGIFVYVNMMSPGVADVSWNERPSSQSAQAPLGEVRRDGACWVSNDVRLCAWNSGQRPQRQAQVQQPAAPQQSRGARAVSFYAQTSDTMCIQASGRLQENTPIILGDCRGSGATFIPDAANNRISFASNRQFCMGFDYNGQAIVLNCAGVEQSYRYDQRTESIRFESSPGERPDCVGARGAARIGSRVLIEPCANAPDQKYSMTDPMIADAAPPPAPQAQFTPPPAQPRPQQQAALPRVSFFTQTAETMCVVASRPQDGAPVVVGDCQVAGAGFFYDAARSRIRLAQNTRLCIGIDAGGESNATVQPCDGVFIDLRYEPRTEFIRRVGENDCVGARGPMRRGARLQLEDCSRADDLKFSMIDPVIGSAAAGVVAPQPQQQPRPQPQQPPQQQAFVGGPGGVEVLTINRFSPITDADLSRWNSSGCSFAVKRGRDLIAIFDTQDARKTAVFKVDGRVSLTRATGGGQGAYWIGIVAGHEIRLIKGRVNPNFRNDGGGQGGDGRVEWRGPEGEGVMNIRWEEGC